MKYQTDDIRITGMEEVIAPAALIEEMPISTTASQLIFSTRQQISDILDRRHRVRGETNSCSQ